MGSIKMTPFERSVCAWILQLPSTWTKINWNELSHTDEQVLDRLVKGGFVEARLPVILNVAGTPHPITTQWRVRGAYGRLLSQRVKEYLAAHGYTGRETGIICGEFREVRLSADGELAQEDFQGTVEVGASFCSDGTMEREEKPGIYYDQFSLVSGGPDGTRGIVGQAEVRFDEELPSASPAAPNSNVSQKGDTMKRKYRFSVAFSFPGEYRQYVERVDLALASFVPADQVF